MLLREAVNQTAYVKAGLLGFGGSGKTMTAALLALGLAKEHGRHHAVAMFDTETGSDFLIPIFQREGVKLYVHKGRAFADLITFFREAPEVADACIVDSVTHVWQEIRRAYEVKLKRKYGLDFRDWGPIKQEWQGFTDAFVNSQLHAVLCGRAGFDYDYDVDAETGKKELVKTGIKMKAEGEMGYEPSLLIEMERVPVADTVTNDPATHGWFNRATVLKDRSQQLNGAVVDFRSNPGEPVRYQPVLEFVRPHLAYLNIGGEHLGVDTSRSSVDLFESPESRAERRKQVEITCELILDSFVEAGYAGTSAKAKETQVRTLKEAFGTSSWTAIQNMRLEELQAGHTKLRALLVAEQQGAADRAEAEAPKPKRARPEAVGA